MSSLESEGFQPSAAESAELRETHDAQITPETRKGYKASAAHFLNWLYLRSPTCLLPEFIEGLAEVTQPTLLQRLKDPNQNNPPIDFNHFSAHTFLTWILSLRSQKSDQPLSFSTLSGHRAALRSLFRDYGVTMTAEFAEQLDTHFCGKRKKMAREVAEQGGKAHSGKAAFSHDIYVTICGTFLQGPAEFQMAGLFFRLTWNLMCRANNASSIAYKHLEWHNDALRIYFVHSKTDQEGKKVRHPRHCYANPFDHRQCLVTALAIYWLLFPPDASQAFLFPGSRQYDRYRVILTRLLDQTETKAALAAKGLQPNDIGSHSGRKSSASFITSGTTAAPSTVSTKLRGGWSQEGQGDVYFHPDPATDQYIGRLVSGLPIHSADFAVLPPFFMNKPPEVERAIDICFPGLPSHLREVGEYCLASLLWHADSLLRDLPAQHPLRSTTLFRHSDMIRQLRPLVDARLAKPDDRLTPTGIPPHVMMIERLSALEHHVHQILPALQGLPSETVRSIIVELERRAMQANAVTYDGLRDAIAGVLDQTGLTALLSQIQSGTLLGQHVSPPATPRQSTFHSWGGSLHRVAEDFQFPKSATVLQMVQLWFFGSDSLPPFRTLTYHDLPKSKTNLNRLSDVRFLMRHVTQLAAAASMPLTEPSQTDVAQAFDHGILTSIEGPRRSQKHWRTFVTQLRRESKRARGET